MTTVFVRLFTDFLVDPRMQAAGSEGRDLYVLFLLLAKLWGTDGIVTRGHCLQLPHKNLEATAARLVEIGVLEVVPDGWRIVAWLKYNVSIAQIREANRRGGQKSGEVRLAKFDARVEQFTSSLNEVSRSVSKSTPSVLKSIEVPPKSPDSDSVSVSACTTTATSPRARVGIADPGNGEPAPGQPEDNGGEYEPSDPTYVFDPRWRSEPLLALWEKRLGKIQPGPRAKAAYALERLHNYHRLSPRQLEAMVRHVVADPKARSFWGTGRSPASWLDPKGSERVWQRIMASVEKAGGAEVWKRPPPPPPPVVDPNLQAPPKPPPADPACKCRNGWRKDRTSAVKKVPCLDCSLGRWVLAHDWNPAWKPEA